MSAAAGAKARRPEEAMLAMIGRVLARWSASAVRWTESPAAPSILARVTFVLTAVGAALAVALELFEAMAIVLAVALTRRTSAALAGAGAATVACGALAVVLGPVLVAQVAGDALRVVVGV